ncbi:hypothetical protein Poli38472_005041 [Pythium oligandrum]|uniref:PDZ domain-containing protein n=1 Tax=Pythium oligandrum TaxID=41045 RepID=A0A8K1CH72_PYTOL|nr:hypothetical protein Poli38472_005041 [Pythium oligandrum]|eukprot:TMW62423.1 hypothetical protein Poli38472_005041 [Pythium oligandrum]
MGQGLSRNGMPGGDFYVGPIYATSLSHDRQTEVRVGGLDANGNALDTAQIGPRGQLPYLEASAVRKQDFFKRLGLVVKTRGSRLMQNAEVVITDYYRLEGKRFVPRDRVQGPTPTNWHGVKGPAESSTYLRTGDTLYAINHRLVVNKSKGQVLRQIHALLEKNDSAPVVLTWKHTEDVNSTPWELEVCLPPPEGEFVQLENEWGPARPTKISSVSI